MDTALIQTIIFFLLVAFVPSIIWVIWLVKRSDTSLSLSSILIMFFWGAIFAIIIAVVMGILIPGFSPREIASTAFFGAVILAPITEEFAKPLGIRFVEWDISSRKDGIILGATAGLGFAATENLLYEFMALGEGGWGAFWATALLRSFAACALHASATALTGQGFARASIGGRSWVIIIPFFILAVILHGLYNYLAISGSILYFLMAMLLALGAILFTRYSASY